jgi:amino acid transporter
VVVLGAWVSAYHDIRISTKVMLVAELVSVATLLLILAWAMARSGHWVDPAQFHIARSNFAGIRLALVLVSTTLAGFESATTLGEEAKGAKRSIPRAMLLSLIPTGLLYLSATYCLVALSRRYSVSIDQATLPFQVLADVVGLHWAGWLSSLGIVVSCFVCAMAGLNAGSRVIFSMARDGVLPAALGWIHPVHATPVRAVGALGVFSLAAPVVLLAGGVALTACMDYTIQIDSLGYLGSYLFVCVAAPFFLLRQGRLSGAQAASSGGAFLALGGMVALSIFPLPAPPWCYLPLSFVAFLAAGVALSLRPRAPSLATP